MAFWKNRGVGRDGNKALTSGRIGPTGLRTFHCKIRSLKGSGRGRIAYIHGLDQAREDIVLTDGKPSEDIERMSMYADMEELTERERRGTDLPKSTAFTAVIELPYEAARLSPEKLTAMCNGIADELRQAAGINCKYRPTWAVHRAGRADNLHLHIVVVADAGRHSWQLIPGAEAMKTWRQGVAGRINRACGTTWHGGTLADTGIDRPAKKRLPTALYRAREDVEARGKPTSREDAQSKRRALADAAKRVQKHLDEVALAEWRERKKREAEAEAVRKAESLRDQKTGPVSPEIHQELAARGLTTIRRARAAEERAREEGRQEGRSEAQKPLQRPPRDRGGYGD